MKQKKLTGKYVFPSGFAAPSFVPQNLRQKYLLSNTVRKTFIQPNTKEKQLLI